MKQFIYMSAIIASFIIMLLFPKETFLGASNGLLLWFQIVLPTLLPFIIVSNLFIHTNAMGYISRLLSPFLRRLFSISESACYVVLVGFLCGYPMGAKATADLVQTRKISKKEGQYLLSFCNNTSPMFIISFIVMQNFKDNSLLLGTLTILLLTPVLCSFFFRKYYKIKPSKSTAYYDAKEKFVFNFDIFDHCMMNSFDAITRVGGYMILFSILFSLCMKLQANYYLPFLEISNGIPWIMSTGLPMSIVFPYVLALTSFGGLCAVAQTTSMIRGTGIHISSYIIQKLITSLVTSFLAFCYIQFIH